MVPYFETVVSLFQKFDTFSALTGAGVSESFPSPSTYHLTRIGLQITPSNDQTYELTDLQDAVTSALGFVPDVNTTLSHAANY